MPLNLNIKGKLHVMDASCVSRQLQQEYRDREETLKQQLQKVTEKAGAQIKDLQHHLQDSEERLKGLPRSS